MWPCLQYHGQSSDTPLSRVISLHTNKHQTLYFIVYSPKQYAAVVTIWQPADEFYLIC